MSAAATAAGYLYASGRLRGRAQRDQEGHTEPREGAERPRAAGRPIRVDRPQREVRVAALPDTEPQQPKPRRAPTIQYRVRRWRPSEEPGEE
ncbi:MAG TPA: hypothetical protein VE085_10605 [Burkholderiales bacterium]|nr:hypothetical protein [Burkholderiales bacterium]